MSHLPQTSDPSGPRTRQTATTRGSRARTARDGIRRTTTAPARPTGLRGHAASPAARPVRPAEGRAWAVAGVPECLARHADTQHAYARARGDRP
ncbi:hypothetical protein ACIOKD_33430 [Streptomyces sp. NPDC087844]|uniref:hypothetical protein n=1 Tax=Streptomyces sp. NPDC087844 TaxID=3365805 RepID=UPI003800AFCB